MASRVFCRCSTEFVQMECARLKHPRFKSHEDIPDVWYTHSNDTQVLHKLSRNGVGPRIKCDIFRPPEFVKKTKLGYNSADDAVNNISTGYRCKSKDNRTLGALQSSQ